VWQGTGREAGEPPDSVCHHRSLLTYQLLINYYARPWYMGRNFAVPRGWWSRSRCAGEQDGRSSISENKRDYGVGRGKPPVHGRFKKGNPATRADRSPKNLPALLAVALNETVVVTIDGERRVGRVLTGRGLEI
jgi:hypothetical protein